MVKDDQMSQRHFGEESQAGLTTEMASGIVDRAIAPQAKRDLRFGAAQQLVGSVSQCLVLEIGMGESVSLGTQSTCFVLPLLVGPGTHALGMTRKLIWHIG